MWVGDVIANRFEIKRPIGSGGMGSVFLAHDRHDNAPVAIKVLDHESTDAARRFLQEAHLLARIDHPGVVRYVYHGVTGSNEPFLAMELLIGVDLEQLLSTRSFSLDESVRFIRRAAEALLAAHDAGIVHRDVKPSNLFLVGGDVDKVKVLDFGIARPELQNYRLTRSGAMLGTIGYMSPEQARGSLDVDARADVFSLGCVLFECLVGKAAFVGRHAIAVLAKVLSEEPPKLRALRPELPPDLERLVSAMLSKRADERPTGMGEVISALDAVTCGRVITQASSSPPSVRLSHEERRFVTVILATSDRLARSDDEPEVDPLLVAEFGEDIPAECTRIAGGSLLLVFAECAVASDQAVLGARRALALRRGAPHLRLVLATGRTETGAQAAVGEAIDRAASLLNALAVDSPPFGVPIDAVTEGLLGSRFVVDRTAGLPMLLAEQGTFEAIHKLMGRQTPFVGREKELSLLEASLAESLDERIPRSVLITAEPGMGKTRLGLEFVQKARARPRLRVFVARAEHVGASSALGLAQQLVAGNRCRRKALDRRTVRSSGALCESPF